MPLPAGTHSGVLPKAAGYHHYPKPIVDIDHFRYDDFELFVTDDRGLPAAVVPVSPRGSGDGRVRLLAAHPDSPYAERLASPGPVDRSVRTEDAQATDGEGALLSADDLLAQRAFRQQT